VTSATLVSFGPNPGSDVAITSDTGNPDVGGQRCADEDQRAGFVPGQTTVTFTGSGRTLTATADVAPSGTELTVNFPDLETLENFVSTGELNFTSGAPQHSSDHRRRDERVSTHASRHSMRAQAAMIQRFTQLGLIGQRARPGRLAGP
jgi:hypothetical protein